jgi:hypothetical protein
MSLLVAGQCGVRVPLHVDVRVVGEVEDDLDDRTAAERTIRRRPRRGA